MYYWDLLLHDRYWKWTVQQFWFIYRAIQKNFVTLRSVVKNHMPCILNFRHIKIDIVIEVYCKIHTTGYSVHKTCCLFTGTHLRIWQIKKRIWKDEQLLNCWYLQLIIAGSLFSIVISILKFNYFLSLSGVYDFFCS